ncbi:hypothetical protein BCR39DRAFT_540216 [Naematelia encephala]|uniref:Uncharacterized protein n=1 Tax=Naematelia encephala TaxID=71784 RepID=A0A1Y2AX32_9TREE|nr:hypothetical protein BCR39DRAFT_540216 [Naematelia encephala]
MSFRVGLLRSANLLVVRRQATRAISTSSARRAAHHDHHDDHHHSHPHEDVDPDVYTHPSFLTPAWRNTALFFAILVVAWPYIPSPPEGHCSPNYTPEKFKSWRTDPNIPFLTRLIARWTEDAEVVKARNDKHLELEYKASQRRLLFSDAQRPKVMPVDPRLFDLESKFSIPVGTQLDLSDVKGKKQ